MNLFSFSRRARETVAVVVASAMMAPSTASALNPEIVPSVGADTGRFTLDLTCAVRLPWLGGLKIIDLPGTADIQGIAPVQLGPGQEFWLSQGSGGVELPQWLSALANLGTITRVDVELPEILIGAAGATPATINLADKYNLHIERARLSGLGTIQIGLPTFGPKDTFFGTQDLYDQLEAENGGIFDKNGQPVDFRYFNVGPFIAPDEGRVQFRFEGAKAEVTLHTILPFFKPRAVANCKPSKGNSLLSVAVGENVDPSKPAKYEGEPLDYPEIPSGTIVGIVNAPYSCNFKYEDGSVDTYDLGIAVGGNFPLAVKRDVGLTFVEASGAITISPETAEKMAMNGITTIEGQVHELNLFADNGVPELLNVLPDGTEIPPTLINSGVENIISLPTSGTVTAGPIFADNEEETLVVGLGSAKATLSINSGEYENVEVSCARPVPDALLLDAETVD